MSFDSGVLEPNFFLGIPHISEISCKSLENWLSDGYLQAILHYMTHIIFRVIIVGIQMVYIGAMNFTEKNQSESVFFGSMDRKRLVLGGPVQSLQYLGQS
jgi:hypothetical protein